jgi:hypothetical protein
LIIKGGKMEKKSFFLEKRHGWTEELVEELLGIANRPRAEWPEWSHEIIPERIESSADAAAEYRRRSSLEKLEAPVVARRTEYEDKWQMTEDEAAYSLAKDGEYDGLRMLEMASYVLAVARHAGSINDCVKIPFLVDGKETSLSVYKDRIVLSPDEPKYLWEYIRNTSMDTHLFVLKPVEQIAAPNAYVNIPAGLGSDVCLPEMLALVKENASTSNPTVAFFASGKLMGKRALYAQYNDTAREMGYKAKVV